MIQTLHEALTAISPKLVAELLAETDAQMQKVILEEAQKKYAEDPKKVAWLGAALRMVEIDSSAIEVEELNVLLDIEPIHAHTATEVEKTIGEVLDSINTPDDFKSAALLGAASIEEQRRIVNLAALDAKGNDFLATQYLLDILEDNRLITQDDLDLPFSTAQLAQNTHTTIGDVLDAMHEVKKLKSDALVNAVDASEQRSKLITLLEIAEQEDEKIVLHALIDITDDRKIERNDLNLSAADIVGNYQISAEAEVNSFDDEHKPNIADWQAGLHKLPEQIAQDKALRKARNRGRMEGALGAGLLATGLAIGVHELSENEPPHKPQQEHDRTVPNPYQKVPNPGTAEKQPQRFTLNEPEKGIKYWTGKVDEGKDAPETGRTV
jgi:hypothetical protein